MPSLMRTTVAAVIFVAGMAIGAMHPGGPGRAFADPQTTSPFQNLSVFARALAHIENSYVDDVDQDALIEGAIRGMAEAPDPHTTYIHAPIHV